MSNPPLNADLDGNDAWSVLGVARGADRAAVRAAYVALVRKYKPEHHPEEFKRIRAAYETALAFAEMTAAVVEAGNGEAGNDTDGEAVGAVVDPSWLEEQGRAREAAREATARWRDLTNERDRLWTLAIEGDIAGAFAGLSELATRNNDDEEIVLRQYWLRKLLPAEYPAPAPSELLALQLERQASGNERLTMLYYRELIANPAAALSMRCRGVIEGNLQRAFYFNLIACRWQAAAARGRYRLVARDFRRWSKLLMFGSRQMRLALLFQALDYLRWGRSAKTVAAFERLHEKVERGFENRFPRRYELRRLDRMQRVWKSANRLRDGSAFAKRMAKLAGPAWCGSADQLGRRTKWLLERAGENSLALLAELDQLGEEQMPLVLQLRDALADMGRQMTPPLYVADDWENADARLMAMRFFHAHGRTRYRDTRTALLQACIEYSTPPDVFADASRFVWLDEHAEKLFRIAVEEDAPLQLVWMAQRIFWR